MSDILENLKLTNQTDLKQKNKTKYPLNKIIGIALFAMTTDANNFADIAAFADIHHKQLQQIFPPTPNHPHPQHHHTRLCHANPTTYKPSKISSMNYKH
ncbi:MAG: transposase family protein [Nitrososphaerota archaeon]|jgi:hypothetical protein|nr:transposase family protein [Nitrososphaerota archaeon]